MRIAKRKRRSIILDAALVGYKILDQTSNSELVYENVYTELFRLLLAVRENIYRNELWERLGMQFIGTCMLKNIFIVHS